MNPSLAAMSLTKLKCIITQLAPLTMEWEILHTKAHVMTDRCMKQTRDTINSSLNRIRNTLKNLKLNSKELTLTNL